MRRWTSESSSVFCICRSGENTILTCCTTRAELAVARTPLLLALEIIREPSKLRPGAEEEHPPRREVACIGLKCFCCCAVDDVVVLPVLVYCLLLHLYILSMVDSSSLLFVNRTV